MLIFARLMASALNYFLWFAFFCVCVCRRRHTRVLLAFLLRATSLKWAESLGKRLLFFERISAFGRFWSRPLVCCVCCLSCRGDDDVFLFSCVWNCLVSGYRLLACSLALYLSDCSANKRVSRRHCAPEREKKNSPNQEENTTGNI